MRVVKAFENNFMNRFFIDFYNFSGLDFKLKKEFLFKNIN